LHISYPSINKSTFQFTKLPFDVSFLYSWGFGNNTEYLSYDSLASATKNTGHKYSGLDLEANGKSISGWNQIAFASH
jgi:hypothetical protein